MGKLTEKINNLNPIFQNIVVGTLTSVIIGFIIKEIYLRTGGYDLVWIVILIIGPLMGFLSGKERLRIEKMKMEKEVLEEDFDKVQTAYKQSVNKYRLLFDNISDAIYLTTEDGRFLLFNEAACLLSGYSRDELRNMTMAHLQMDEEALDDHRRAWLDNGICRYEERWRTKSGKILYLEVNSKWIKLSKNQFILHISRDILHRVATGEEKRIKDIGRYQEIKLTDLTLSHQFVYNQILGPVTHTLGLIDYLSKKYTSEEKKISQVVSEWDKAKKFLQGLLAKNNRDLQSIETNWNLNDVLRQELHYLELLVHNQNVMVNTRFSPELPPIAAPGRQLSLILGNLLLALVRTLEKARRKEMLVSTQSFEDHVLVQIQTSESDSFEKQISQVLDPTYSEQEEIGRDRGMAVMTKLLESVKGKLEIHHPDKGGTVIQIAFSTLKGQNK